MNIRLFSIKLPILVKICTTITEILTFNKWSQNFTISRSVLSYLRSMELTDVSMDAMLQWQNKNKQIILLQIKFVLYPKLAWAQAFLEKWQLKG